LQRGKKKGKQTEGKNKMKNVLILNPYLSTLGGGEKHMGYFCRSLEDYYHGRVRIDILVFNTYGVDVYAEDYVTVEDLNRQFGLELQRTAIKKMNLDFSKNRLEWIRGKRDIEKVSKGYDLFVNFMFLSRHAGRAKVNIYECFFPPKRFAQEWKGWKKILGIFYDFTFYYSYGRFISNSLYTNHWLEEYWKAGRKNRVIYPPVFSENEVQGRYQEPAKRNVIISVGRFFVGTHSKKQLDMIRFFVRHSEIFSDYEYHIAGAVSEKKEDADYLRQVKEAAALSENIYIHENCSYEELLSLYRAAKIFWHATGYGVDENLEPEKMEHFGITTVEAMSFGAVPVVINKGGQKETVEEGVNGCRWDTEEECVEKTEKLIKNDALRIHMAEKCVESARRYSVEAFQELNKEVFHELKI